MNANAVEAEALGAMTARLTAALALLASSSPSPITPSPELSSSPNAVAQLAAGSHAAAADAEAWSHVVVRVVAEHVHASSAPFPASTPASSAFRVTLRPEPPRGLPDRLAVASFVAGAFAGGVAGLPAVTPPHQGSCFELSTAMAGKRTLRTYSWRALPSPIAQLPGGRRGGEGGYPEEEEDGEGEDVEDGEGEEEGMGQGGGEAKGPVAWAMVGARCCATPKAQRGLLHSFEGTSVAFTWSPVFVTAAHAAQTTAVVAAAAGAAAAAAAAASAAAVNLLVPGTGVPVVALPHPPSLRGLPSALRALIEVLPEGVAITLQLPQLPPLPPTSRRHQQQPPTLPPPPTPLPPPPTMHQFLRRPVSRRAAPDASAAAQSTRSGRDTSHSRRANRFSKMYCTPTQ